MTPTTLEQAVCRFVQAAGVARVMVADSGIVELPPPYAVVGIVSDEDDGPADTLDPSDPRYTQHRQFRIQVDVIGTPEARVLCQRIGLLWRAECAARRAAVAEGIAPTTASGLRIGADIRGGSGQVQSASVDLAGYYRLTIDPGDAPDSLVDRVDLDVTGVDGPDVEALVYLYALAWDDGSLALLDGGTLAMLETA